MNDAGLRTGDLFESQAHADEFAAGLATRFVGLRVVHFDSTPSTNDDIRRLAAGGEPEGTVVVAESQTAGRGRAGRTWHSPAGSGLLFSYLLRPPVAVDMVGWLTGTAALGTAAALREHCRVDAAIEWPNDIVTARGKLGGVLAEAETSPGAIDCAVVGVGLNVNLDADQLPDIDQTATSVSRETAARCDRAPLFAAILRAIDTRLAMLYDGRAEDLAGELAANCRTVGTRIDRDGASGTATGIDTFGRLVVTAGDGSTTALHCSGDQQ